MKGANRHNGKSCETVDGHERGKDFLTPAEIDQLLAAAKDSRYRERDRALVLVMFRHGLRVSEVTSLRLKSVNLKESRLWVHRLKNGLSTDHPIAGDELRAIKRYLATRKDSLPWLFVSERGGQMTRQAVAYVVKELASRACLPNVHPHTLRHSCGYALANKGMDTRVIQDYLGHKNPTHTAHYTRTAATRFEGLWG